ncbi:MULTISPECIES: tripartite tricarboxylate transporter TctB family protein [unclassified Bosea (in: a-proteobacteria)]|uniref:tripartite tricarboxylate transporter TctB family protein n=1 Tax=unclassified Bosea (in: a-proteobacteria) TaxID=2653178 RepID=UPI00095607D7|nr:MULTISPECIES: tripartite tricarboxylate transporter TctB family protein [unclassified Bosea (in: a-proteobacteria)]TAJ28759.1 MAG: tripartite tricarboxylate transporter TctB family protein [Bosea sp. (in: a-proteobacteria)]SIR24876.1 putative tricarboxylic transport membrane protein [Bosea sp. TND4EK4]
MRFNDTIVGAAFVLLAAAMIALTFSFPSFPGQNYGPSLFPRILGAGIILCSLVLIIRDRREVKAPWLKLAAWTRDPRKVLSFALMIAAMLFYIFASETLGFIPCAFAIQIVLFLWFGVKPVTAVIVAVAMTLLVNWFFGSMMLVPLPRGILDSLL